MKKQLLSERDYTNQVLNNLINHDKSDDYIAKRLEVIKHGLDLRRDRTTKTKNLLLSYMPEAKNVTFERIWTNDHLGYGITAMIVPKGENNWTVTFTFCHPDDMYNYRLARKNAIKNYVAKKYTYDVIAFSAINSVVKAYNANRADFPSSYQNRKISLSLRYCYKGREPQYTMSSDVMKAVLKSKKVEDKLPECLITPVKKFKATKQEIFDKYGIELNQVRFYIRDEGIVKGMALKKADGSFVATFSFVSPIDRYLLRKYGKGTTPYAMIDKTFLMRNFIDNKFTYDCPNVKTSMDAIVSAFNEHKKEFPNYLKSTSKMYIAIEAWNTRVEEYDIITD